MLYASRMSIGSRIRQLRKANGLNGDQFGDLCGVTKGMVSQWESDLVTPPTDRLLELRGKLNFSFDWLLEGTEGYSTTDPKIIATVKAMENTAEYVKDAAVQAVLTTVNSPNAPRKTGKTHKARVLRLCVQLKFDWGE